MDERVVDVMRCTRRRGEIVHVAARDSCVRRAYLAGDGERVQRGRERPQLGRQSRFRLHRIRELERALRVAARGSHPRERGVRHLRPRDVFLRHVIEDRLRARGVHGVSRGDDDLRVRVRGGGGAVAAVAAAAAIAAALASRRRRRRALPLVRVPSPGDAAGREVQQHVARVRLQRFVRIDGGVERGERGVDVAVRARDVDLAAALLPGEDVAVLTRRRRRRRRRRKRRRRRMDGWTDGRTTDGMGRSATPAARKKSAAAAREKSVGGSRRARRVRSHLPAVPLALLLRFLAAVPVVRGRALLPVLAHRDVRGRTDRAARERGMRRRVR